MFDFEDAHTLMLVDEIVDGSSMFGQHPDLGFVLLPLVLGKLLNKRS